MLEGEPETEAEVEAELVTTGTSNSTDGCTSIWYHGRYPLHRRPLICVQEDLKRRESDQERQLHDEPLLKKWPRVPGEERERLLAEGLKP